MKDSMKKENKEKIKGRLLKGTVVSDKMDKTVVVKVNRYKKHPKYQKRYRTSRRYKAHDAENKYREGEQVMIQECRPLSKNKKWRVKGFVQSR